MVALQLHMQGCITAPQIRVCGLATVCSLPQSGAWRRGSRLGTLQCGVPSCSIPSAMGLSVTSASSRVSGCSSCCTSSSSSRNGSSSSTRRRRSPIPARSSSSSSDGGSAHRGDVNVVLVNPQIPQNAGNVARSCAATAVALHLVAPLGFEIDDKKLKRAGLDYWPHVCVKVHDSWQAFYDYFKALPGPKRLIGYSVYGSTYYAGPEFQYQPGDWLLFGAETTGLPMEAHTHIQESGGALVKIPLNQQHVRSLNLSVSVGVGLFEALRQLDAGQHEVAPRDDSQLRLPTPFSQQQQQPASN